jgi:subtilisin family serine protease
MNRRRHLSLLYILLCLGASPARAQLHLPSPALQLPGRLGPFDVEFEQQRARRLLERAELPDLRGLRLDQATRLLRRHPDVLEPDPRGEPAVRGEILAWSPTPAALALAARAGLAVVREEKLDGLDETMVVLRVPPGAATADMLERLRQLDPAGSYDFNHLYTGSGGAPLEEAPAEPAAPGAAASGAREVGLVDSGVDTKHEVFRDAHVERWGCNNQPHPSEHGTAVGALMVGHSARFQGVAPQATLFAADIYCDSPTGGSADKIAGALGWLARERVGVINISLVGPPNQALERVVAAMLRRGHLLVAAVGNDGPAAPPLYPASYPGVVGVSGVDRDGRPLPEAARGPQVMFAAPGSQMVSAAPGEPPYRRVRGTSFAAPLVAGLLAGSLAHPDPAAARSALAALARQAAGGEPRTLSNAIGYGIVAAAYRTDPARFR